MSGRSNPQYHGLASRVDCLLKKLDRTDKRCAWPLPQPLQLQNFHVEHTNGLFKVIHLLLYCGVPVGRARICKPRAEGIFMKTILSVCLIFALTTAAWAQPQQKTFVTTNK